MHSYGLEITPRPDLPAIVARWQREITASELQAGYFAILATADELGCWRWLLDLRRREELVSGELTTWMNTDFFPQLVHRYHQPVRIAFLISPRRAAHGHSDSDSSVAVISATSRPDSSFLTSLFTDEALAYQWLSR